MQKQNKKHLDFEVNLIPCIDLLSVCICFLLLTAVWINIGAMNVKQAVGGQPADETAKKPVMWVMLNQAGDLTLTVQDSGRVPAKMQKVTIAGRRGRPNYDSLTGFVAQLKQAEPTLTTALIQPQAQSAYEDIIEVMDQFKKIGLSDLGVAPL